MEFYNQNTFRRYPFRDDVSLTGTVDGSPYTMGNDVFTEARFFTMKPMPAGAVTLISLRFVGVDMQAEIDFAGATVTLNISVAAPDSGWFWTVRGQDDTFGVGYMFMFAPGIAGLMDAVGTDVLEFDDPPAFLPTCVRDISQAKITSISASGARLTGALELVEGYNCSIGVTASAVRISALAGRGAGYPCARKALGCSDVLFRVNGATADEQGELTVTAGTGIKITSRPSEHTLDIQGAAKDEC